MHVERMDEELSHTCFSLQVILIFCLVLVERHVVHANELKNYSICMTYIIYWKYDNFVSRYE